MLLLQFKIFVFLFFITNAERDNEFDYFWQVTDIHYDSNYSSETSSPSSPCNGKHVGTFGDYSCDSPWKLAESAIGAMQRIKHDASFILWTGDSVAHVSDATLNPAKAFTIVKNVTDLLKKTFPSTKIFPTLGNHDSWPANSVPIKPDDYYKSILSVSGWDQLLDKASAETFSTGGYYFEDFGQVRIFGLNTIIWYTSDPLVGNSTDPGNQVLWLDKQLVTARTLKKKVILTGHIPPGYFSAASNTRWFYERFNDQFHKILQEFSDIIIAAIFGHEHKDSFKIVYKVDKGAEKAVVPIFLAPAVTPWNNSYVNIGPNNPSIRLYKYHNSTGIIQDYTQYFLNLTKANIEGNADWEIEYSLVKSFEINDASADSLHNLIQQFQQVPPHDSKFQQYFKYNSVSYNPNAFCDPVCKLQQICGITCIDTKQYNDCVNKTSVVLLNQQLNETGHNHRHHIKPSPIRPVRDVPRYVYYIIGGLVIVFVFVFLLVAVFCCHKRAVYGRRIPPGYVQIHSSNSSSINA